MTINLRALFVQKTSIPYVIILSVEHSSPPIKVSEKKLPKSTAILLESVPPYPGLVQTDVICYLQPDPTDNSISGIKAQTST